MACLDIGGYKHILNSGCLYLVANKSAGLGNQKQIIELDSDSVDKKHAVINVKNGAVHLIDLVSNGGSYVDDLRLALGVQVVTASESVLRFGDMSGKLILNRTAEKLHESSGFDDSVKNSSISDMANSSLKSLTSTISDHHSFLLPQARNQETKPRKSDSFYIPDTQFIAVESSVNKAHLDNAIATDLLDTLDDENDDFCIPETQDVPIDDATRHLDGITKLATEEEKRTDFEVSEATDLDSGTQLRICTQDFNENANDESRCSTDSDILLSSAAIPFIKQSPAIFKDSAKDRSYVINAEMNAINWSAVDSKSNSRRETGAISTERKDAVTPDLFDLTDVTNNETRLATCTPDLFELTDLRHKSVTTEAEKGNFNLPKGNARSHTGTPNIFDDALVKIDSDLNIADKNVTSDNNKLVRSWDNKSMQGKAKLVEIHSAEALDKLSSKNICEINGVTNINVEEDGDDEDNIATQPFISHRNISNFANCRTVMSCNEERSCTPDLFEFAAPANVANVASKGKLQSMSREKSIIVQVHTLPPPNVIQDEDEDDLMPTQLFVPLNRTTDQFKSPKDVDVFSAPQNKFAEEQTVLSNKENRRAHNSNTKKKLVTAEVPNVPQPDGDDEDLIPTQVFIPSRQMNSTLVSSDGNSRAKNAASFFEAMESTPPAKPLKNCKITDEAALQSPTNTNGFTGSHLTSAIFCTPQIISNNWQHQINKSKLVIGDETDEDTEELGTFDDLVPTSAKQKVSSSNADEAQKRWSFKLAFDIQMPPEQEKSRADRALKREIRNIYQKTIEDSTKKSKHVLTDDKADQTVKAVDLNIETNTKQPVKEQKLDAEPVKSKLSSPIQNEKSNKLQSSSQNEKSKSKKSAKEKGKSGKKSDKSSESAKVNREKLVLRIKPTDGEAQSVSRTATTVTLLTGLQLPENTVKQSAVKINKTKSKSKTVNEKLEQLQLKGAFKDEIIEEAPPRRQTRMRLNSQTQVDKNKAATEGQITKSSNETRAASKSVKTRKKTIDIKERVDQKLSTATSPSPSIHSGSDIYSSQRTDTTDTEQEELKSLKIKLKRAHKESKDAISDAESDPNQMNAKRRVTRQNNKLQSEKPEASTTYKSIEQQLTKNNKRNGNSAIESSDKGRMKQQSSESLPRCTRIKSAEVCQEGGRQDASSPGSSSTKSGTSSKMKAGNRNDEGNREKQSASVATKNTGKLKYSSSMVDRERIKSLIPRISPYLTYVNEPTDFDVLIMDEPNRTFKFLVAMARGRPILNSEWLETVKSSHITHTEVLEHFFVSSEFQKKYSFSFKRSFQLANSKKILTDYEFLATPNIQPTPKEFKVIIECAGGTFHTKMPPSKPHQNLYLISNNKDKKFWHKYRREYENLRIVEVEAILLLVMRQSLRPLQEYLLS